MSGERYYHGGFPGLRVGRHIEPPVTTGVKSLSDLETAPDDLRERVAAVHRKDRVYLTTDLDVARMFAGLAPYGCCHRGGDVYEVAPVGAVEHDPDWMAEPGQSVAAARGRITAVIARGVRRAPYLGLLGGAA